MRELTSVNVGATVTSLEVVNAMRSSALRSIPPSAMIAIVLVICWIIPVRMVELEKMVDGMGDFARKHIIYKSTPSS